MQFFFKHCSLHFQNFRILDSINDFRPSSKSQFSSFSLRCFTLLVGIKIILDIKSSVSKLHIGISQLAFFSSKFSQKDLKSNKFTKVDCELIKLKTNKLSKIFFKSFSFLIAKTAFESSKAYKQLQEGRNHLTQHKLSYYIRKRT